MKYTFKLTSVNTDQKIGLLKAKSEESHAYTIKVQLSDLLVHCIEQQREGLTKMSYEDHEFTSEDRDPLFKNNPFKLVKFHFEDGSIKNFRLQHVKEAGRKKKALYDAFNRRIGWETTDEWAYHPSTNYRRYVEQLVTE